MTLVGPYYVGIGVVLVEPRIPGPGMVEDAIQHDIVPGAIRVAVNIADQLAKGRGPTQGGIDVVVILGIVFVVGRSGKDGIQVDDSGAQRVFDVVKLLIYTLQVAAEKYGRVRVARVGIGAGSPGLRLGR